MTKRLITFAALGLVAQCAPGNASTCERPSAVEPHVFVFGTVTKVERGTSGGTNAGATSIFSRSGQAPGSNTATILVAKKLKGDVPDVIRVTSQLQDGINLGVSFREGPILVAAYRGKDGSLNTNGCGLFRSDPPKVDKPPGMVLDEANVRRLDPVLVLEEVRSRVEPVLSRLSRSPGDLTSAHEATQVLGLVADFERIEAIWRRAVEADPTGPALEALGRALYAKGAYPEAISYLERAKAAGADVRDPLAKARYQTGASIGTEGIDLRGFKTPRLVANGSDLKGRDLSGAFVQEFVAEGADLTGTVARGLRSSKADLRNARADGADFTGAGLNTLDVSGAMLRDAKLEGLSASLKAIGADLSRVSAPHLRAHGAKLAGAKLDGADLTGATLDWASGRGASFKGADLTGASLKEAVVSGMDFSDAKLRNVIWDGATFDCATTFPPGFLPARHGLVSWDGSCPGKHGGEAGQADGSAVHECGKACHEWLLADTSRSIVLVEKLQFSGSRSEGIRYAAGFSKPGETCLSSTTYAIHDAFKGMGASRDLAYRDKLLKDGFCPVISLPSDRTGLPPFAPGSDGSFSGMFTEASKVKYLPVQQFKDRVVPAIRTMLAGDSPFRDLALHWVAVQHPKGSELLAPELLALLAIQNPSADKIPESGETQAKVVNDIADHVINSAPLAEGVLDAMEGDPSKRSYPGLSAALAKLSGQSFPIVSWGNPVTCRYAARIEKLLPPWGKDAAIDVAWARTTSKCRSEYAGPLAKALRDGRPEVVSTGLAYWYLGLSPVSYHDGRERLPAVEAVVDAVIDLLVADRVPDMFLQDPAVSPYGLRGSGLTPMQAIAAGLVEIQAVEVAKARLLANGPWGGTWRLNAAVAEARKRSAR